MRYNCYMSRLRDYFSWWRLATITLFLTGITTYLSADWYWMNVCAVEGCGITFIDSFLAPLRAGGLVLAVVTAPFLVVSTRYFKAWLLWVFLPATAFTLWNLSIIRVNDGIGNNGWLPSTTREQVMENYLWVWLIVTLLFIMVRHYRYLKSKS